LSKPQLRETNTKYNLRHRTAFFSKYEDKDALENLPYSQMNKYQSGMKRKARKP